MTIISQWVCTCARPRMLARCLRSLGDQLAASSPAERRKNQQPEKAVCGTELTQPVQAAFPKSGWRLSFEAIQQNWRAVLLYLGLLLLMLIGMAGAYFDLHLPE